MMKYIFAIPIYALSKEHLSRKVKQKERAIIEKRTNVYCQEGSKYMDRIISEECTPMNIWEYNHIIGYIKIGVTAHDVWFEFYLCDSFTKYNWTTHRKKFIRPYQTIGDHFCVEPERSNIDIGKDIKSMLENVKESNMLNKYFVDSSIFDETYMYLDYNAIMSTMRA